MVGLFKKLVNFFLNRKKLVNGRLMKYKMSNSTEKCIQFLKEKFGLDISMYDSTFPEKWIKIRMEPIYSKL
jgi:hypothetical protein